jgi:hypothetical protein
VTVERSQCTPEMPRHLTSSYNTSNSYRSIMRGVEKIHRSKMVYHNEVSLSTRSTCRSISSIQSRSISRVIFLVVLVRAKSGSPCYIFEFVSLSIASKNPLTYCLFMSVVPSHLLSLDAFIFDVRSSPHFNIAHSPNIQVQITC